ncbi:MAG: hypothetical protein WC100_04690 [Sterolibacterium sp.]
MSEMKEPPLSGQPPSDGNLPVVTNRFDGLIKEVFDLVGTQLKALPETAGSVSSKVESYAAYVQQLKERLESESRRLVTSLADEQALAQQAEQLRQVEAQRLAALHPYLVAGPVPGSPITGKMPALVKRLQSDMATELETLRDARLRFELRRAELVNQKAGMQVRIVLNGAAQIKVHFGSRVSHGIKKD